MNTIYTNMPFQRPDAFFKDELYSGFIVESIQWIESSSCGGAFASNFGSSWEAAYILSYLIDVCKILKKRNDTTINTETIYGMCDSIVDFLIKPSEHNPITNWDGNTWDTSVVANALLYYIDYFGIDITDKTLVCNKMKSVLPSVIKWLYDQFMQNEAVYSQYSFGDIDYARILFLFVYICRSKYRARLLQPAKLKISDIIEAIHSLMKHIDKSKVVEQVCVYSEITKSVSNEQIINWGDCFITAEICDAVSQYLLFISEDKANQDQSRNHDEWQKHIYSLLKRAMRWVETVQSSEGMWGAHDDTIRCLTSYIATIAALKKFEEAYLEPIRKNANRSLRWVGESDCEEHKVFKAIRWLFDPKQRFSDGSYLHTSFLSVFFFETYISIYNHWVFADGKTIYKIYDEVFWMSPARTTLEKGQVIELEIERERNLAEIKKLSRLRNTFFLCCAVTAVIAASSFIAIAIGLLQVTTKVYNDNVEALALIFTLVIFILTTIGARYFTEKGDA